MENSIRITLLTFGLAREITGSKTQELQFPAGTNVAALRQFLEEKYPLLNSQVAYAVAINRAYAEDDALLSDLSEIAILPPVSGG